MICSVLLPGADPSEGTHLDEAPKDAVKNYQVLLQKYLERFKSIQILAAVSCVNQKGIKELAKVLAL